MRLVGAFYTRILTDAQGMSLSARQIFEISCATEFYGLLLPGALLGGAIRWYKLARRDRKPAEVLMVIVFGRILDTIILALLGLGFLVIDARMAEHGGDVALLLFVVFIVVILLYALVFARRVSDVFLRLAPMRFVPKAIRIRLKEVHGAARRFENLSKARLASFLLLNLTRHALGILSVFSLAVALHMPITLVNVGSIRSVMLIVTMLPITISGLGVREASLIFLSDYYGALAADAVAWSFLILCGTLLVAAIGGVIEARDAWFPRLSSEHDGS